MTGEAQTMSVSMIDHPSPNWGDRKGRGPIDMVVLHYTGMANGDLALERLSDPTQEVSAHYLVEEDGRIFRLVPEHGRAWHAGVAYWQGERDINSCSIGIEIVNPGHTWGYRPFPERQVRAVEHLLADIVERHGITPARILGHSDVAPGRKEDPGELFPWPRLAAQGFGVYPSLCDDGRFGGPGALVPAQGSEVAALRGALAQIGYEIMPEPIYDPWTETVVRAFQRHFEPEVFAAGTHGSATGRTRARAAWLSKNL